VRNSIFKVEGAEFYLPTQDTYTVPTKIVEHELVIDRNFNLD